ncbi:hypothetical protein BN2476_1150016 [Paraburkholderia piptadeniae]|uniref:Uncharacterized protein n=1 Tax=Paraburkholderia piptadeniae TaxID=1701573 RepID=A0A1N7SUZ5_9BURK|nr:hypothetical protein BN2476_1150016 [Paraburkholderia piptadeniae]
MSAVILIGALYWEFRVGAMGMRVRRKQKVALSPTPIYASGVSEKSRAFSVRRYHLCVYAL